MKQDIIAITKELSGARFSVITFDREASLQLPFTTDATATNTTAEVLEPEITLYSAGSSIDTALPLLTKVLKSAQKDEPDRARIVFYLGDGEQTADGDPDSFKAIAKLVDGGAVLGYGTKAGGKMRERSGFSVAERNPPYIQDRSGDDIPAPDAVSKLDTDNLETIAREIGVDFHQRTEPGGADAIARGIDVGSTTSTDSETDAVNGIYWAFGIPLGLLAVWELVSLAGLLAAAPRARRQGDAPSP
jgi:Ca-activated chloride channel family protein